MIICKTCGKTYPSRYYFVTSEYCNDCFAKLGQKRREKILKELKEAGRPGSSVRSVEGHKLVCPVCSHDKFWTRKTLMNTPGMTFWGIEWANKQAKNYVCDSCGYVMWFMAEE